jgi:tRNA (adenine22-N1)-methyltransferase
MQLSRRLQAVADTVTKGNRVADVGCDHAYISIYLIRNDIAPKVIAMDVNKGPLKRATENIKTHGYAGDIDTRLSDGLRCLKPGEADTILIAGMGGALAIKILEEGFNAVETAKELILQPQSEINLVRKYLHQSNFSIVSEQMVKEDGKYYFIIKARPEEGIKAYGREVHYQYGKLLLEQKEPLLKEFLKREQKIRNEVIHDLTVNSTPKAMMRLEEVNGEMAYINEALSYFA